MYAYVQFGTITGTGMYIASQTFDCCNWKPNLLETNVNSGREPSHVNSIVASTLISHNSREPSDVNSIVALALISHNLTK